MLPLRDWAETVREHWQKERALHDPIAEIVRSA
jgi:hypothetical protein